MARYRVIVIFSCKDTYDGEIERITTASNKLEDAKKIQRDYIDTFKSFDDFLRVDIEEVKKY